MVFVVVLVTIFGGDERMASKGQEVAVGNYKRHDMAVYLVDFYVLALCLVVLKVSFTALARFWVIWEANLAEIKTHRK